MKLTATNFVRNGYGGLFLRKGDVVTPCESFPAGTVARSNVTSGTFLHRGLSACWGWTPAGEFRMTCENMATQFVNAENREFFVDCARFIAPSDGTLRLYVTPGNDSTADRELVVEVRNGAILPTERMTYTLSQWFDPGQLASIPPGAYAFNGPPSTNWSILELPFFNAWTAFVSTSKNVTPSMFGVIAREGGFASWLIAF